MFKTLALSALCLATVTGCATQSVTQTHDLYRADALQASTISSGACDSVGQTIVVTPQYQIAMADAATKQAIARGETVRGQQPIQATAQEPR